jgi:hypothetical protein
MICPIIIRCHEGVQSYLVLDDNPRELLRHVGFAEPFSVRPWLGSLDPQDALEEWAEMLAEDPTNYMVADSGHRDYCLDCSSWDHVKMWPERQP